MLYVLIFTALVLVPAAAYGVMRRLARGKAVVATGGTDEGGTAGRLKPLELLERTLKALNCEYEVKTLSEGLKQVWFTFQGGHFVVFLDPDRSVANLTFPDFLDAKGDELNLVRMICNGINNTAISHYTTYKLNPDDNTISLHITASLVLEEVRDFKSYLSHTLTLCFALRLQFIRQYEKFAELNKESLAIDPEENYFDREHLDYMLRKREERNQGQGAPFGTFGKGDCTLNSLMQYLTRARYLDYLSLRVAGDEVLTISEEDEIARYDLPGALVERGTDGTLRFSAESKVLLLNYAFPDDGRGVPRLMTLTLEAKGATAEALYVRVTACGSLPATPDQAAELRHGDVLATSLLLACDKADGAARLAEFKYLWEEAREKQTVAPRQLPSAQELAAALPEPGAAYHLYWGKKYFNAKRFFEAQAHLLKAWNYFNPRVDKLDEKSKEAFYSTSFYLGCCYQEVGLPAIAYYFLDGLLPLQRPVYAKAYINCVVALNDFRAEGMIDNLMANMTPPDDEDDATAADNFKDFARFLRRSKGVVCMNKGKLGEAERIFKKMLGDPREEDFALSALERIRDMRLRRKNEAAAKRQAKNGTSANKA